MVYPLKVKKAVLIVAAIATVIMPLAFGFLGGPLHAQSILLVPPGQQRPMFDVASVKPTTQRHLPRLDRARYSDAASLLSFIVMAYGLKSCAFRVANGEDCSLISGTVPAWVNTPLMATTNLFEIQATLPDNSLISSSYTPFQLRQGEVVPLSLRLQVLLEDRFHLKLHRETKERPVYALTIAKNGPKVPPTGPPVLVDSVDGTSVEHHGFSALEPVLSPDGSRTGRRRITLRGSSMQQVADNLTTFSDRPVIDQTGLKGEYDLSLEYDVDPTANPRGKVMTGLFTGLTCSGMSSGLQDVGLKCESTKGPVEILVIDHVERPSEN